MQSSIHNSPGLCLRQAMDEERPLQMVGTINAFCSLLAEAAAFRAIYLSGAGVANASFGLPDLGITTPNDVLEDVRRITAATDLPLMVDADTGWGNAFNISRAVRELSRAGAAGCHIEDQVQAKRCGHRPNKELVGSLEMVDRIKATADGRTESIAQSVRPDLKSKRSLKCRRVIAYMRSLITMNSNPGWIHSPIEKHE